MSIDAMKAVLDFLERGNFVYPTKIADDLRAAITEAEKVEPTTGYEAYKEFKRKKLEDAGFLKNPLREITTPQPAPAWQPIETPPQEWGSYLIWHPKYGMETLWFQLKDGGNDGRKAGNWYSEEGDDDYPCNARVTHWMPLPAAPKPENMK